MIFSTLILFFRFWPLINSRTNKSLEENFSWHAKNKGNHQLWFSIAQSLIFHKKSVQCHPIKLMAINYLMTALFSPELIWNKINIKWDILSWQTRCCCTTLCMCERAEVKWKIEMEIDSKYKRIRMAWERDKQWKCQSSLFIEIVKLLMIYWNS